MEKLPEYAKAGTQEFWIVNPYLKNVEVYLLNGDSYILDNVPESSDFYFVHSYVICPEDDSVIKAYADYGVQVPAVVQYGKIVACQFHPEKSGEPGLQILKNFCGGESC